jgi:hypothetical protein
MKYKIIRLYKDSTPSVVMFRGFTKERAEKHCKDMHDYLETFGWMDVYEEQKMEE